MKKNPKKVYIDANIFVQFGKSSKSPIFGRLKDLVIGGFIEILTTDLTRREVAKTHAENDFKAVSQIVTSKFRRVVKESLNLDLPEFSKDELMVKLLADYECSMNAMFEALNSKELKIDEVRPSTVFDLYVKGTGIFDAENKKNQFPDAFIFECIKSEASLDTPVVIVSRDKDFRIPVEIEPYIEILDSVPELFKSLGLEVEAPDVQEFLENQIHELVDEVENWLSDRNLIYEVIENKIQKISVTNLEILEPASFGGSTVPDGTILVVGWLFGETEIVVTHPHWEYAIWDPKLEQFILPVEDTSIDIETEFMVEISLTISIGSDGKPKQVEAIRFLCDESDCFLFDSHQDGPIIFT